MKNIRSKMILFLFIICLSFLKSKNIKHSLSFHKTLNQQSNDTILNQYKPKIISFENSINYFYLNSFLFHNHSISIYKNLSKIGYITFPKGLKIVFELDSIKNVIREKKKFMFFVTIYLKINRILLLSLIKKIKIA